MPEPISPLIDKHAQAIAETIHPLYMSQLQETDYLKSSRTTFYYGYATVTIDFTFNYPDKEKKDHAEI